MVDTIKANQLIIHPFPQLAEMKLEDISDFLEQNAEKHFIGCRNWSEEYPYHPLTLFTIGRTHQAIYVDFFVRCNYLRAVNYTNNSPVADDSCVEFFLRVPGSNEYWNIELNCIGTVNASHRSERHNPTRLTDDEIAQIGRYASCGARPFEEIEGVFTWNVTLVVPFSLIDIDPDNLPQYIEGNFNKCAQKTGAPHYLSWSPILTEKPDFHRPEFFGKLYFNQPSQS